MQSRELYDLLEVKYRQYNSSSFIESDPILIPHRFKRKEDIEIAGFLAATIAWGQRPVIIRNASRIMEIMNDEPYEYILKKGYNSDKHTIRSFCHRTFNGDDLLYFFKALNHIYTKHGSMEPLFASAKDDIKTSISKFREEFLSLKAPARVAKHVSDPISGSAAKRLNMYLRWMVRKDNEGVDFGIWKSIKPSSLFLPLDVHTGNVARKLDLLERKQSDWKAVEEVTAALRKFDKKDPVKYDFALFGLGIFEGF
jgi:uncharacterized protein (TIGR02757 family)